MVHSNHIIPVNSNFKLSGFTSQSGIQKLCVMRNITSPNKAKRISQLHLFVV